MANPIGTGHSRHTNFQGFSITCVPNPLEDSDHILSALSLHFRLRYSTSTAACAHPSSGSPMLPLLLTSWKCWATPRECLVDEARDQTWIRPIVQHPFISHSVDLLACLNDL